VLLGVRWRDGRRVLRGGLPLGGRRPGLGRHRRGARGSDGRHVDRVRGFVRAPRPADAPIAAAPAAAPLRRALLPAPVDLDALLVVRLRHERRHPRGLLVSLAAPATALATAATAATTAPG
jgi:hypothetical protein